MGIEWEDSSPTYSMVEIAGFGLHATDCGWFVEARGECMAVIVMEGEAPTLEAAKLAAVEAWRAWTKAQAEAAGFVVADPVEPEVGGDG